MVCMFDTVKTTTVELVKQTDYRPENLKMLGN